MKLEMDSKQTDQTSQTLSEADSDLLTSSRGHVMHQESICKASGVKPDRH